MPTDTSGGSGSANRPGSEPGDDLVFTAQDLGRDRQAPATPAPDDTAFVTTAGSPVAGSATAGDGFVISQPGPAVAATPQKVAPTSVDVTATGHAAAAPAPAAGAIAAKPGFRVHSAAAAAPAKRDASLPWTVRDPSPSAPPSRRGWSSRQSGLAERSAQDTLRRLREDAVHVSWKSAWIAVTSADRRLFKRRDW
ncbi:MAG: hypothetical protein JF887_14405 [Candidatus Dormibacteraeota bacterium]|uniref:Uncharacterized protein n=1 Tax=Candidatus Amunia macphersoniae TaxID=3127014 RepID=A0A934NHJ5_9BACT|nr:hypothetical protein [Candidatus Dormibacteraeota bacterium]